MINWLNKHFGFTKREFNGILILIFVSTIVYFLPLFYRTFFIPKPEHIEAEKLALSELVLIQNAQKNNYQYTRNAIEDREFSPKTPLFNFDPNLIDLNQWQQLGLSAKQAQAIINYRNKGGKFFKAEDLKKMYTISPAKYAQLLPYVSISKSNQVQSNNAVSTPKVFTKKEFKIIELNKADTLNLMEISGVGVAFARRIAKYRNRLGGFYKKEQLMEVYGIDSLKFNEIKDQVKVDVQAIQRIPINKVEFEELKNHPYLNYKQLNAIIQYRKQHGNYKNIDDLKKVLILPAQVIQNLSPYLIFND